MGVVASQLTGQVSVIGSDKAKQSFIEVGLANDALAKKFASFKPFDASRAVTQQDVLQSRLAQIEVQVEKARAKLKTLQDAADAGQAVTGIPEALVKLNSLEVRAGQVRDQLAKLQTTTPSLTDKLKSLASQALETGMNFAGRLTSGVGSFISSIGSGIGRLVEFGSKIGMTIFGLQQLARGAMSVAQALIGPAMQAEGARVAFTGLLNSADLAGKFITKLQTLADKTPFELPQLEHTSQMLLGFGFNVNSIIPMLIKLGDTAGRMNLGADGVDRMALALGQMQAKTKTESAEMLQMTEMGIPAWDMLAKYMHKSTAEVQDLASRGLIPAKVGIDAILQGMTKFKGGMDEQSKTLAGLGSTLQDVFTHTLQDIGEKTLPGLKAGMSWLINALGDPSFKQFATTVGTDVNGVLSNLGTFITQTVVPGFQNLADWGGKVGKAFDTVGFQNFVQAAQNLGHTLADILFPKLQPVEDGLKGIFSDQGASAGARSMADAFNFLAGVLGGLNTGIHFMQDAWHNTLTFLQPIGAFLSAQFGPTFKDISNTVQTQLVPAWDELVKALQPAMPIFQGIAIVLGAVLVGIIGIAIATVVGLAKAFAGMLPGAIQAVSGVIQIFTGFVQFFDGIGHLIYDIVTGNFGKIGADLGEIWQGLVTQAQGLWNLIAGAWNSGIGMVQGFVSGFVDTLIGFFTHLWDRLVGHSIIPDMINAIVDWFRGLPGRVMQFVSDLIGNLISRWDGLSKTISDKTGQLRDNLLKPFNQAKDQIGGIARSFGNFLIDGLNAGVHGAVDFVNKFADAIDNVASALGQKGPLGRIPYAPIPHYASGTPSGGHPQDGVALVGERGPEAVWLPKGAHVFPADMTKQLMAHYAGGTPGAGDILSWIGGGAQGVLNSMLSAFHIGAPSLPGKLSSISGAIFDKVKSWALGFIDSILPKFDFGSQGGGSFGGQISGNLASWIMQAIALTGVPGSWAGALGTIAMHESGGNPNAVNLTDVNAQRGDPSRGLFQTIMATFRAYALPGHLNIFDPVSNAAAAIGYIKSRYGDVFHVPGILSMASGGPYVGYANGGIISEPIAGVGLRTGTRYAFGEGGRREVVTPIGGYMPAGTRAIPGGSGGFGGQPIIVHVHTTAEVSMNGTVLTRQLMPEIVQEIRGATGVLI